MGLPLYVGLTLCFLSHRSPPAIYYLLFWARTKNDSVQKMGLSIEHTWAAFIRATCSEQAWSAAPRWSSDMPLIASVVGYSADIIWMNTVSNKKTPEEFNETAEIKHEEFVPKRHRIYEGSQLKSKGSPLYTAYCPLTWVILEVLISEKYVQNLNLGRKKWRYLS